MRSNLKIIFFRIFQVLAFYTVTRIIFVLNYPSAFEQVDFIDQIFAGLHGIRFDLAVIFISNLPIILFWSLPLTRLKNHSITRKIVDGLFIVNNSFWLCTNLADMAYFKFSGRRSTIDILWLSQDASDQSTQLVYHFIHILFLIIACVFFFYRIYMANQSDDRFQKSNPLKSILVILLVLVVSFVVIRGKSGSKPLRPGHAFIFEKDILGHLALNTPFMVIRNLKKKSAIRTNHYTDRKELMSLLESKQDTSLNFKGHNVVVIIMESFALEYLGHKDGVGYTPFLLELSKKSLFFDNAYANGRRSIEALPSILASIPSYDNHSFINSIYQSNQYNGVGDILKNHGYHTSFFHGGKNGTMGFDIFSKLSGLDHYYGQFQFPNATKEDTGYWGIHDGPFFQFFEKKLSGFKSPFLSVFFSLSSHQPFEVPSSFKVQTEVDPMKVSLYYADASLKHFFEVAKTKPWYKDTLFIITGDHTSLKLKQDYQTERGDYLVPLLFWHPSVDLSKYDSSKITQHIDIVPSILDFVGVDSCKRVLLGQSVFAGENEFAVSYNSGVFKIFTKEKVYHFGTDQQQEDIPERILKKLKAYIQYFNNSLIDNSLHRDGFCFQI
jgi:phosphoglycerol transferase MdoB-like AlkP superfamily enzyme